MFFRRNISEVTGVLPLGPDCVVASVPTQFQVRFTAACVKSCVCCRHAAQLTAAVPTQTVLLKDRLVVQAADSSLRGSGKSSIMRS